MISGHEPTMIVITTIQLLDNKNHPLLNIYQQYTVARWLVGRLGDQVVGCISHESCEMQALHLTTCVA